MKMQSLIRFVLGGILVSAIPAIAQTNVLVSRTLTDSEAQNPTDTKLKLESESKLFQGRHLSPLLVEQRDLEEGLSSNQISRFKETIRFVRESVQARGGVAGGGGNEKEGSFVSLARILLQHLLKNEVRSSEILGINISEFQTAIDRTEVHCAANPELLSFMRELKKVAFFTTSPLRINLDCENYESAKKNGDLGAIVIFHEYMRTIGKDTSSYETSSKLPLAFNGMASIKEDLLIDPAVVSCFETFKKIQRDVSWSGYLFGLGHQLGFCLQDQGLNQAVDPNVTGLSRIKTLSGAIGRDLTEFNRIVTSVLRRP